MKKLNARLMWVDPISCIAQHETDPKKVKAYRLAYCYSADFPPVHLAEYDGRYLILDGHHRVAAAASFINTGVLGWVQSVKALVVDGAEFDELDCEQQEKLGHRADHPMFCPTEREAQERQKEIET